MSRFIACCSPTHSACIRVTFYVILLPETSQLYQNFINYSRKPEEIELRHLLSFAEQSSYTIIVTNIFFLSWSLRSDTIQKP